MFEKVLIANRGEIAVRVIRACRDLGIRTVAVYSEADVGALHVRHADEAYLIGPAPAAESYLDITRILDVAKRSGADAVHPGYGFLSENAEFARAVRSSGRAFIGPSAEAIALMGSKLASRQLVSDAGVPIVPGSLEAVTSDTEALEIAADIGFPLMLKASAGGGGKGMRRIEAEAEMHAALRETRSEALSAFGDDAIYIEKAISRPRHIEIQIVGDRFGAMVHLGERECTIQRRHQKVIEEAPSPCVDPQLRDAMGAAALSVSRAAAYDNVGTVEFLLDGDSREFYFLEMNTRVQVEHAVTEAVTGIDLVVEQIRIASGEPLGIRQEDVRLVGAAIECRIYAENWENGFMPSPGRIQRLAVPSGPWIRDDSGVYEGWEVPVDYDPLLSKLVTWGPGRSQAIGRMQRALSEYSIDGIESNLGFFREVVRDSAFLTGDFDTEFVGQFLASRTGSAPLPAERDLAVVAAALFDAGARSRQGDGAPERGGNWRRIGRANQLRDA